MIGRIISCGGNSLGKTSAGKRSADLGPVAGFIVLVGQIAQQRSTVLFVGNARYPRRGIVSILYQNAVEKGALIEGRRSRSKREGIRCQSTNRLRRMIFAPKVMRQGPDTLWSMTANVSEVAVCLSR